MENIISKILGIKELDIVETIEHPDKLIYIVQSAYEIKTCPRCGTPSARVHDTRSQWIRDLPQRGKKVFLKFTKRRFRCLRCEKPFIEPLSFLDKYGRTTLRFRKYLFNRIRLKPLSEVAEDEGLTPNFVERLYYEKSSESVSKKESKEIMATKISIDEFATKKGHKYNTAVINQEDKDILGIIPGRRKEPLRDFLVSWTRKEKERVREVTIDMNSGFKHAIRETLPNARITADKFHVLSHLNHGLSRTRTSVQERLHKGERLSLFRSRYLLLKRSDRLGEKDKERVNEISKTYPDIKRAYFLKEEIYDIYRESKSKDEAKIRIKRWIAKVRKSNLPFMIETANTYNNWLDEITNFFDSRVTNARMEGINNKIKVLKRSCYGFRNMQNFRIRIMMFNHMN